MNRLWLISLILLTASMSSCSVISGVFKAGMWTGILVVVVIFMLLVFLIKRGSGNGS
jgi:hypothetical protein